MIKSIGIVVLVSIVLLVGLRPEAELQADQVLSIANSIADYEGYVPSQSSVVDYEITDKPGGEMYDGYISLQIMVNAHPAHFLSIDKKTGHVVDFEFCQVFHYKIIQDEEKRFGVKYLEVNSYDEEMIGHGCGHYKIINNIDDLYK